MYIGSKQIKDNNDWLITFEDWTSQKYTQKALEYLITDKPIDPSTLQDISCIAVAKDIVSSLLEHDVRLSDLNTIFAIVQWTIDTERSRFLCKSTGLYKSIEIELEWLSDDEKKIQELNKLDQYARQVRMSHYTNINH